MSGQQNEIKDLLDHLETLDIMGDPEMMAALRQGIKDVQEGNLVPLDEVKASLGIDSSPAS
jgi:hypothetical protein